MWVVSLKLFTYLHMLSFEILTLARLVSHMLTDPSPTRKIYLVLMNNSCSFPIPFFTLLWRWCHWYSYNVWVFIYWQLYFFKAKFFILKLLYINSFSFSLVDWEWYNSSFMKTRRFQRVCPRPASKRIF